MLSAAIFVWHFGLNIFYFLNKYDNISIHCNLQITGSEQKQEYLYSSSPEFGTLRVKHFMYSMTYFCTDIYDLPQHKKGLYYNFYL